MKGRTIVSDSFVRGTTRKWVVLTATAALALATAGCGGDSSGNDSGSDTVTLMGSDLSAETVPYWVAQDKGYFAREGIKVKYIPQSDGAAIAAALVGNSVDVAGTVTQVTFPYMQKDVKLTALAPTTGLHAQVIVANDVPTPHINDPWPKPALDLKGLKVAVRGIGGIAYVFAANAANEAGLDAEKDMTFVNLSDPGAAVAAFTAGKVDALVSFPPVPQLIGDGKFKTLIDGSKFPGDSYKGFITSYMMTTQKWADSHEQEAVAMCKSIREATSYIHDPANLSDVTSIIENNSELTPEQAKSLAEVTQRVMVTQQLTPELWKRQSDFQLTPELKAFSPPYDSAVYQPCAGLGVAS
jgi:NitT/TauT family transport system substrate-binding protein